MCAPARPGYDKLEFSKLLDTTYTHGINWAYPTADGTPVRMDPRTNAPATGTLALHFVRLLNFEGADGTTIPPGNKWARVVMPDGKTGYAPPGSLSSLTMERLCYTKEAVVGWRISGYIAGGN